MFAASIDPWRTNKTPTKLSNECIFLLRFFCYRIERRNILAIDLVTFLSKAKRQLDSCVDVYNCFHTPRKSPLWSLAKLTYPKQEQHPCRWAIYGYLKSFIQWIWEDAKNQFKDNTPNMFWSTLTNAVVVNYNGFSMNLLFMKYRFAYILSRMKTPYYTLPPTKWKFLKSGVVT